MSWLFGREGTAPPGISLCVPGIVLGGINRVMRAQARGGQRPSRETRIDAAALDRRFKLENHLFIQLAVRFKTTAAALKRERWRKKCFLTSRYML